MKQKRLWKALLPASRSSSSRQTLTEAPEGPIKKTDPKTTVSPSTHTITCCLQTRETAPHPFPTISLSVQRISMCILNEYFSVLSQSVYKSMISEDLCYSLRPCFLLFLPKLFIFCFVMVKVPQSLRTFLIHTNDCPLFDIIENACTSCWEE